MNNLIKKGVAVAVILLFISVSVIPSTGSLVEKKSTVSFNGNTLYVGGLGPGNYTTIQAAIDNAEWDDTVFVYDDSSPYYEHIIIDKGIQLTGEEKNTTIIDGEHIGDVVIIDEYLGGVVITGFTIQNSGNYGDDAAIENRGSSNLIAGNIITNNDGVGVYCNGMDYEWCEWNIISGNVFTHNGVGIFLDYSFNNEVYDNYISDNGDGIDIGMSSLPSVRNFPLDEFFNNIYQNTITNNTYGIYLHPSWYAYIYENNITNNKYGISIEVPHLCSCKYNYIYQNNIVNNQKGIFIWAGFWSPAEDNEIYLNNFIGNVDHASDNGNNIWDNGSIGNYWDDYEGFDGNGDDIGDTSYVIYSDNVDHYPVMKAMGIESNSPDNPIVDGPNSGKPRVEYDYIAASVDPDGDDIRYVFDWDDRSVSWSSYVSSGESVIESHAWTIRGNYKIRVKARDRYGYDSGWVTLEVSVPRNKVINMPFNLLEKFLERFPLLNQLIMRLVESWI